MKKKVRIYKAPDGKGKFVNKTAKFLHKAQQGGQQDQQAQIANYVYKTLNDAEPFEFDTVKESLITELAAAKVPIEQAEDMVENIATNLQAEIAQSEQLAGEDQDIYNQGIEDLKAQEEAAAAAEEERQAGLAEDYGYYDDTAADGEDDEDEEDDDIPEEIYMQYGGDIIPEDNPVSFTGYNPDMYTLNKQQSFAYGGMTKRKYVGKVMQLLKKAQEGQQTEDKEEGFDPTDTADKKKSDLNKGFVNALANTAKEAKMKEQAEAMWEQQQQMMQQQVPQYPMQAPMEQVPMAQSGMSVRQMRRMMPRGFGRNQMRSFAGMVPPGGFFPMGMNIMTYPQMQMPEQKPIHVQGTIPGMKLDVRKSHWLTGRPSQYSIEFGGDGAIPGFNMMPGMGYGTKSTQRKTIEGVSKLVNKIADPANDIKKNEPSFDTDKNNVPDNIQSNAIAPTKVAPTQYDKNGNGILDVTEVATNLPATTSPATTNPNKDAVGKGAKVPTKTATNKTVTASKSKQVGQVKQATPTNVTNKGKITTTPSKNLDSKALVSKQSGWKKPDITVKKPTPIIVNQDSGGIMDWINNNAASSWDEVQQNAVNLGNRINRGFQDTWGSILGFQTGGFVDSTNPDLYKFIYGGDDAITQQDINYSDSKNTGSPYFAKDGLEVKSWDKNNNGVPDSIEIPTTTTEDKKEEVKKPEFQAITSKEDYDKRLADEKKKWETEYSSNVNLKRGDDEGYYNYPSYQGYSGGYSYPNAFGRYFPANTVRRLGTWTQQQGMPYDPRTGTGYSGGFGPNTQLSKIDVRKSGWLSGRPRKYTMYFNNPEMDPTKPQFSINTGEPGTTETSWGDELKTRKEKREGRRYDKFIKELKSDNLEEPIDEQVDETKEEITTPKADVSALENATVSGLPDYTQSREMMDKLAEEKFNAEQSAKDLQNKPAQLSQEEMIRMMSTNPFLSGVNPNAIANQNRQLIEQGQVIPNVGANPEIAMGSEFMPPSGAQEFDQSQILNNPYAFPNVFTNDYRQQYRNLYDMPNEMNVQGMQEIPQTYQGVRNFQQYTGPFEGSEFNDDTSLYGTMDGMSEETVRNREIAAKQKYNQQQAAIRQQQLLQQQQQQQAASGSNKSSNAALKEKTLTSNRQVKQFGDWRDTWDIKGVINKNKNQLETLKDSPIGQKTLFAIDSRWENMSEKQRKAYGSFNNYLKTEGYDKFYNMYMGDTGKSNARKKQYGGSSLNRFLYGDEVTKTSTGTDSPIVYTNNPALEGIRDVDIVAPDNSAITTLQPSSFWSDQQSFNQPTMNFQTGCTEEEMKDPKSPCYDMEKYGMKVQDDALGSARETTEKTYTPKAGQFAVDFKNKNTYEVDAEGSLLSGNALARGLFGALERRGQNKQYKNFYDQFTSDNIYASDPSRDRGDYETNSGLYRPNEQGQIWNSRSKQLGGFMQDGGFVEGDVVDMTPEELEEFIANGGEVEIIS